MAHYRRPAQQVLPKWLWFFLILPLALIVALLFRRRQVLALTRRLVQRGETVVRRRYIEPVSIPLERQAMAEAEIELGSESLGTTDEDSAMAVSSSAAGMTTFNDETSTTEPINPFTTNDSSSTADLRNETSDPAALRNLTQAAEETGAPASLSPAAEGEAFTIDNVEVPPADFSAPPIPADDLKIIEGIGPQIAMLLVDQGIDTFRALADAPVELLQQILVDARLNRLADPVTWPKQAALADAGRWEALDTLQKSLKAGRSNKD